MYLNSLADWVFDEFLCHGRNLSYENALAEFEAELEDSTEADFAEAVEEFSESYQSDEDSYELVTTDDNGKQLKLGLSCLGGAYLLWVFESDYRAEVKLCSPCVPNAGDLENKIEGGFDCYDLPPDWYRKGE